MEREPHSLLSSGQSLAIVLQGAIYAGAVVATLLLVMHYFGEPATSSYRLFAVLAFMLSFVTFRRIDMFNAWRLGELPSLGMRLTIGWFLLAASLFFLGYLADLTSSFSRPVIFWWTVLTPPVLLATHAFVRYLVTHLFGQALRRRRAAIVFVSDSSRQLLDSVHKDRYSRFDVIGFFEDREPTRTGDLEGVPRLGGTDELTRTVYEKGIEAVFIVLPEIGIDRARSVIDALDETSASVYYVPDLYVLDLTKARVSEINGMPVLQLTETPIWGVDGVLKRILDLVVGSLALIAAAPLITMIGLAIKLDDGGPVFFRQRRRGIDGRPFDVWKFRSMVVAQRQFEFEPHATADDPRVTRVGRFLRRTSLDELPQLLNVLRGDMSLVGPRPHAVSHDDHYRREIRRYLHRHKVPPGMTGWAQVNGLRGEIKSPEDMKRRIEYDLEYIRRWSPALDFKILLLTVPRMIRDESAY